MKLEDQICSLDLAKRLKELGARQESLFWWGHFVRTGMGAEANRNKLHYGKWWCIRANMLSLHRRRTW